MNCCSSWILFLAVCGQTGDSLPGTEVPKLIDREAVEAKVPRTNSAVYRDGFESPRPAWQHEYSDSTINLINQDRTDRAAHEGKTSERFQFEAEGGSQFFVSYEVPRIPLTDDLTVTLFVKSNRSGVRLHARVVLPRDIDPETKAPSFLLIPGTAYERAEHWQKLELSEIIPAVEKQARVLRVSTKRPVDIRGAYVERVVVNLMGGIGDAEVFLDELALAPVPENLLTQAKPNPKPDRSGPEPRNPAEARGPNAKKALPRVWNDAGILKRLNENNRYVDWFPTAIDAPGADVGELRRAGFDALVEPIDSDPKRIAEAIEKKFLIIPRVNVGPLREEPRRLLDRIAGYPYQDAVAFWFLGEHLGRERELPGRDEELERVQQITSTLRHDPRFASIPKLTTAIVDGDLPRYSQAPKNLDIIGILPKYWGSGQEPLESLDYFIQRKRLTTISNSSQLFWAWLPTRPPRDAVRNIWGDDKVPAWERPRILPEQLRLMTYTALSAGYRGLGFLGGQDLTQPESRAVLIELAFLNEEIDLCESILGRGKAHARPYRLYDPDPPLIPPAGSTNASRRPAKYKEFAPRPTLRGAAIDLDQTPGGHKGTLILITDFADNAQLQPSQMAARDISVTLPLPASSHVYEITPGYVKLLDQSRPPGGRRILIPDFAVSTILLCTTDPELPSRVEELVARVRPLAVQLAIQQAEIEYSDVVEVYNHLVADGHQLLSAKDLKARREAGIEVSPNDAQDLLKMARESIKAAREALEREDYKVAWTEARGSSRPLRILMRGFWNNASNEFSKVARAGFKSPNSPPDEEDTPPQDRRLSVKEAKDRKEQLDIARRKETPVLVQAGSCPPSIAFHTLREHYIWLDWIRRGTFGTNLVPSGSFDKASDLETRGWTNLSYDQPGFTSKITLTADTKSPSNQILKMSVTPEKPEDIDQLPPNLDFPAAAIRSPAIQVEAKNLIRISVLVKRQVQSTAGVGGIIIRDSIGGEQFQYRTSGTIPRFSRVVLFRKAPADMNFTVTLGLAGYGEAFFDDLRVEVVEHIDFDTTPTPAPPTSGEIAGQPPAPDPTTPGTAARPGKPIR